MKLKSNNVYMIFSYCFKHNTLFISFLFILIDQSQLNTLKEELFKKLKLQATVDASVADKQPKNMPRAVPASNSAAAAAAAPVK